MTTDVFRFHTIRAPELKCDDHGGVVELYPDDSSTPFLRRLRAARDAKTLRDTINTFLADAAQSINVRTVLPIRLSELLKGMFAGCRVVELDRANDVIEEILRIPAALVIDDPAYKAARERVADTVMALMTLRQTGPRLEGALALMRAIGLIEKFAATYPEPPARPRAGECREFAALLIIALPADAMAMRDRFRRGAQAQTQLRPAVAPTASAVSNATVSLNVTKKALNEVTTLVAAFYEQAAYAPGLLGSGEDNGNDDRALTKASRKAIKQQRDNRKKEEQKVFKAAVGASISRATHAYLKSAGIQLRTDSLGTAVTHLERLAADGHVKVEAAVKATPSTPTQAVAISGGQLVKVKQKQPAVGNANAVVGAPNSAGTVGPSGVADLIVVRQRTLKYELGEIAYIENAARGSNKERTHRRLDATEQVVVTETERTEETERDLQTTERFALHNEIAATLSEKITASGSVTVEGSYGPSVKITANASVGYSRSKDEATKVSSDYAKEVTDRSVSRLQIRELGRTQTTTRREIEETNKYGINNVGGVAHDRAIYRFVLPVIEMQPFNYGRRMMFEFVVPDPAAFYRYCIANPILPPITVDEPPIPTWLDPMSGNEYPLEPKHLTQSNYMKYSGTYQASGVKAFPPAYSYVGVQFTCTENNTSGTSHLHTATDIAIPTGYEAYRAYVAYSKHSNESNWLMKLRIGDSELDLDAGSSSVLLSPMNSAVQVGARFKYIRVAVVNVLVKCVRSTFTLEQWQMDTFGAIMTAYNKMKATYDEAVRARAAATTSEPGIVATRNPMRNREIEREELKRASINILTAQRFDMFNASTPSVTPFGYPEIDLAEQSVEGPYIQFFEQAFEWNNVQYVFYPYFWSNKQDWPSTSRLETDDPMFGRFLRAGAAHVQVPARPGFEHAILHYLESGGEIWDGASSPPHIGEAMYVSLVQEIRDQSGDSFVDARGTLSLTQGSIVVATALTDLTNDDAGRVIRIGSVLYTIAEWVSATEIRLSRPFEAVNAANQPFAIGPKVVGLPWEVRLPSNVVMLQDDAVLPTWENIKTWV